MTLRHRRPIVLSSCAPRAAFAAWLAAACVFAGTHADEARAQASGAAAVTEAASSVAAGAQYAVKPGQSLNDIAGELTGSKDRATREKMARALFDANPNAFMGKDPSRLRLGSVLTVPAVDDGAAAAAAAASAAASAPAESAAVQAPASSEAVTPAPSASAATPTQPVEPTPAASEASAAVGGAAAASGAVTTSAASAAIPDTVPAPAPVPAPATASRGGSTGIIAGVGVLVVLLALFALRASKRRRARESDAIPGDTAPPATPVAAAVDDANLDGAAVQRDEAELNAVAASMEDYDAAQSFETPTDEEPRPVADARPAAPASVPQAAADEASALPRESAPRPAPFMPEAPAARHRDFVPPLPTVAALEAETREAEAREAAAREAAAKEAAAQEAATRAAQWEERAREMERRTLETHAADARAAAERESRQSAMKLESDAREAEVHEDAARQAQAVEPAPQEPQPVAELPQEPQPQEPAIRETPALQPEPAVDEERDDEPTPAARFPQPKFPREAIEALDSLDLGLPPRRELPPAPPAATPQPLVEPHAAPAPDIAPSIEPEPMRPQPVAETDVLQRQSEPIADIAEPPFAGQQIESGTAGPASVAGLGASRFGPMRLDFSLDLPSSQTDPLPAFTPEQIATIARNKLELAAEYIDLGDLSGARTLLQEVIDSNDAATRQQAAALLSTLAPHS